MARVAVVLAVAAVLWPIWAAPLLPLTDLPLHLALIDAQARAARPDSPFARLYEFAPATPYVATYIAGAALARWLPIMTVGRVLLSLSVIGWLAGWASLLAALGRPRRDALLVLPLAYGFSLAWGFLPFLLALPPALLALAAAVRAAQTGGRRDLARLAGWSSLCLATHLFAFLWLAALALALAAAAAAPSWRRRLALLAALAPGLALLAAWRIGLVFSAADRPFLAKPWQTGPLVYKLRHFVDLAMAGVPGWGFRLVLAGLAGLALAIALTRRAPGRPEDAGRRRLEAALLAAAAGLYLLTPYSFLTGVWLFHRLAGPVAAFALLLLVPRRPRTGERWAMVAAGLLAVAAGLLAGRSYLAFGREAGGLIEAVAALPEGGRLTALVPESMAGSAATDHPPYAHQPFLYQLERGGIMRNPFAELAHMPVRYRAGAASELPPPDSFYYRESFSAPHAVKPLRPPAGAAVLVRLGAADARLFRPRLCPDEPAGARCREFGTGSGRAVWLLVDAAGEPGP